MFFGIGDRPAIILIWLAAFWPLLISTIFGVKNVERTLLAVARAARAPDSLVAARYPASKRDAVDPRLGFDLPPVPDGSTVVTAEMIAVRSGLGYMILYAQMTFRPDQIVAGIIVIGFFGLGFDQLIRMMRSYFCRWQEGLVLEA